MQNYNFVLDVVALAMFCLIHAIYRQQHLVRNTTHYLFVALIVAPSISAFADVMSVLTFQWQNDFLFYFFTSIYYIGLQWTTFYFLLYTLSPLARVERVRNIQRVLLMIPLLSITIIILLNPVFHWIYRYDFKTDSFSHSYLFVLCYVPVLIYYFYGLYYVYSRKDVYNKHIRYAILNTSFIMVGSMAFQFVFPRFLGQCFAFSFSLIQILIVSIQQGMTMDPQTKMLSSNSFYEKTTNLIYNEIPFHAITIRIADYEALLSTYGLPMLRELEILICEELQKIIPKNAGYKLHEDIWSILYEKISEKEAQQIQHQLDALLDQKWVIHDVDISFSYFIVAFDSSKHFRSNSDLLGLMILLSKTKRMRYGIMPVKEFVIRDLHREQDVERAIIQALKDHSFEVYYQPICISKNQKFVTSEALVRLNQSMLGPIYPSEFIPIAEKTGLIIPLGDYILEEVCRFISTHSLASYGVEYIEVNLSTVQCLQRSFFQRLQALIDTYQVDPRMICFEITETASNCAPDIFQKNLEALHEAGFKLAIDDFGTGYGNLQRLISMQFDIVKFDNNTTQQICTDDKIRPLFSKMINMLHHLNSKVVSEGVETKEQYEYLTNIDVDYIQGYYFAKPMPGDDYLRFLEDHRISVTVQK